MKSLAKSAAILALAACSSSPPPRPENPPPHSPPVVARGTQDADFWYAPPDLLSTRPFPIPRPREVILSNGVHALLAERHHAPLVSVSLVIAWPAPQPLAGVEQLFGRLVLEDRDAKGIPLSARLPSAAEYTVPFTTWISFMCPPDDLSYSLDILMDSVLKKELRADALADYQATAPERESFLEPRARPWAEALAWLYPTGHPLHASLSDYERSIPKIKISDIDAYRKSALNAASLRFAVAGDVDPLTLRTALERATSDLPAARQTATAKYPEIARGTLLVEGPPNTPRSVLALLPAESGDAATERIDNIFAYVLAKEIKQGAWAQPDLTVNGGFERRAGRRYLAVVLERKRLSVADAGRRVLDTVAAIARGEVNDASLRTTRREFLDWDQERFDDSWKMRGALSFLCENGFAPDWYLQQADATTRVRKDQIKDAAARLTPEELRLIAVGDMLDEKAELERLKLGPVTIKKAAAPKKK